MAACMVPALRHEPELSVITGYGRAKQVIANFDRHAIHHPQTARLHNKSWMPLSVWRPALSIACYGHSRPGAGLHAVSAPGAVCCEGEMYLLGTVLSHFLSLYAALTHSTC